MDKELQIIMLEDVPRDAALVERELRRAALPVQFTRVDGGEEFLRELEHRSPDVVLSDHGLPSFDGFTLLAMVRDRLPDIPFIFVTGVQDPRQIAQAFDAGATDWVFKHRLDNLTPAILRGLRECEERARRKQAELERDRLAGELQVATEQLKGLGSIVVICSSCRRIQDEHDNWQRLETYLEGRWGVSLSGGVCPECARTLYGEPLPPREF